MMSNPFSITGDTSRPVTITSGTDASGNTIYHTSDGKTFSFEQLQFYVNARLMYNAESQLKTKSESMKQRIAKQQDANNVLQSLLSGKPSGTDKKTLPASVQTWLKANGESPDSGDIDKDKWDEWTEVVRSKIDTLSTNSQTDETEIKQLTDMHSEYSEQMSNMASMYSRTAETIIQSIKD